MVRRTERIINSNCPEMSCWVVSYGQMACFVPLSLSVANGRQMARELLNIMLPGNLKNHHYINMVQVISDHFIEPHYTTESAYVDIENADGQSYQQDYPYHSRERSSGNYWIPIGWSRISELLQTVHIDSGWASQPVDLSDEEDDVTVADVAAPYWQSPVGPTWWCHVAAGHPSINA